MMLATTPGRVLLAALTALLTALALFGTAPPADAQLGGPIVALNFDSLGHRLSDDGSSLIINSGDPLTPSSDGRFHFFARNTADGTFTQVDVRPNGASSTAGDANFRAPRADVSPDGRYVAFYSDHIDLDAAFTPEDDMMASLYLRDMQAGTTRLLSLDAEGEPYDISGGRFFTPEVSDDGRFVLYGHSNGFDVIDPREVSCSGQAVSPFGAYVVDVQTRVSERLTIAEDGCDLDNQTENGDISGDGRYVVLETQATNIIPGRTLPPGRHIVLLDRQTDTWEWLSEGFDDESSRPTISSDGQRIAFQSDATNIVPGDTNFRTDIFVLDRTTDTFSLVSRTAEGGLGTEDASNPQITRDGRFVAFHAGSRLAGPAPTEGPERVGTYRADVDSGQVVRVDVTDIGQHPDGNSELAPPPAVAANGSVVFRSGADNLVTGEEFPQGLYLALSAAVVGPVTPPPPPPPPPGPTPPPTGGADPQAAIDEAVAIAQERFGPGGTNAAPAAYAIIATAENFADALSGAVMTQRGPLLFARTASLPPTTATELDRVLPGGGTVYILGGVAAVSQAVEDAITAAGHRVTRLAGDSRFETSTAIATQARTVLGDTGEVALARAFGPEGNPTAAWADSVTGGAWAARSATPIILTATESVHPAIAAFLAADAPTTVRLLGGTAALTAEVESATSGVRTAGQTRADTARQIAVDLWGTPESGARSYLVLDAGAELGWAYGLAGAGLAADTGAPVLATTAALNPPETLAAVAGCGGQVALRALGPLGAGLLAELDAVDAGAC